jgi:hypothetical protein
MSTSVGIEDLDGAAQLHGLLLCSDETPLDVISVTLPNGKCYYGAWSDRPSVSGSSFDVQVKTFGFLDRYSIGNPGPIHKRAIAPTEAAQIKDLICRLFANDVAVRPLRTYATSPLPFSGNVHFPEGWIILAPHD